MSGEKPESRSKQAPPHTGEGVTKNHARRCSVLLRLFLRFFSVYCGYAPGFTYPAQTINYVRFL